MIDWFSKWFDSKYYHILYKNRDEKEAKNFLKNLSKLSFFKKDCKIIDIACGRGRHSLFLADLGYNVTGIDLSKNSIKYAKKFEKENLKFDVSDMRESYKKNSFDIALNLFTSFGYFETEKDNYSSMKAMSDNLKQDGVLVIDFLNSNKVINNLVENETIIHDDIKFKINREIKNGFICKGIQFSDNDKEFHFVEKVRVLNLSDFKKLINFADMKINRIFGNYHLDKFDNKHSERLIILAKKCI